MKRPLLISICDDCETDIAKEEEILCDVLDEIGIEYDIKVFKDPNDLIESAAECDLLFLDVEMSNANGIETAEKIHICNPNCMICFVTNHENYMDRALDEHAFRFWTKPINRARLIYGLETAIKKINSRNKKIYITVGKKIENVMMKEIIYVFHQARYTYVVTTEGTIKTNDSFQKVVSQLTDSNFCISHASCCVNINFVVDYTYTDILCEHNGIEYTAYMSRRKYKEFDKYFKKWSGNVK